NAAGDVNGNTVNYKINLWNGSTWTQLTSTAAAGSVSTNGTFNETTGKLGGNDFTLRNNAFVYTWIGATGGFWTVPTNWSPTRSSVTTNDILQFNNGATLTVTGVPTETELQLVVTSSTNVSFQSTG